MRGIVTVLKTSLRTLLLVFVILFFPFHEADATHAMGSDLTYRCIGGNTYEITLTIYRDCVGSKLTNQQNISIRSDSCGYASFIRKADRVSITELSPLCPAQQPLSTCNGGPLPGVEEHVYKLTYTLPAQCRDWHLSWQLCCRNYAITNSVIGTNNRMYIDATLNNVDVSCNNSPTFTTPPVPYLCDGEPFLYNHGAVDPDGDSLAFELTDPQDYILGVPTPIPYAAGFSVNYPMATSPPNNFNFDPLSGQFSFTPSGLQQGIVAIKVKEYRNGILIGTTTRDLQMVVINCANKSPVINPPFNVMGGQLNGNTFSVCAGSTLSFDFGAFDPNVTDILSLTSTVGAAIPGATVTLNGTNPVNASFSWPTTVADVGNYFFSVTVEDNGCPITGKQVVGYNIIVQNSEILPPNTIKICPVTTQSVQLNTSISNPGGNGSYSWSPTSGLSNPNAPNPTASVDSATSYMVTYLDPGGCPIQEPFNIIPEGEIAVTTDSVLQICLGDSAQLNAAFTLNGPPVPFTFTWDPPLGLSSTSIANPKASPSTTTLYSVTASTLTCDFTANVQVIVDNPPQLDPFMDAGACVGDSFAVQTSGSNLGNAAFSWTPILGLSDPNIANPMVSPASTTTYTLTATNGCGEVSESLTVNVFTPLHVNNSFEDPKCNGTSNGSITAVVTGGGGNPVYTWTPNVGNTSMINNLAPGVYTVIVTDDANCTDTATTTITEPPPLSINLTSQTNISCFGDSSGSISVIGSGGTPGYEYSLDGNLWLTNPNFIDLASGTYTVQVRDANECIASLPPVTLTQPGSPVLGSLLSKVNTDCNNPVGSIELQGIGGTAPYMYSIDGVNFSNSGLFTSLGPGIYLGTVQDAQGCTDTLAVNIQDINEPYLQIDDLGGVLCYGGSDGFIDLSGVSGIPPYQYSFNGGAFDTISTFNNLSAGNYFVVMEDSINCQFTLFFDIQQPDSLVLYTGKINHVECFGDSTGTLLGLATGGVKPYEFSVNNGPFTSNGFRDQLAAGVYTIILRDDNGCMDTATSTILEPTQLLGSVAQKRDVACFGGSDGFIELTANGGTPGYTYSMDGINFFLNNLFPDLEAATYSLYVEDMNGCRDSIDVPLIEPGPLVLDLLSVKDVQCFETETGEITVAGSGGTMPYFYSIDQGNTYTSNNVLSDLGDGSYQVILQDLNGCMDEITAVVNQPEALIGDIIKMDITCFGDSNGRAEATVWGGIPPYTYEWTNGSTQPVIDNLGPGNYVSLVIDSNDCQISLSIEIIEPPLLEFDSMWVDSVTCFGGSDGLAAVAVIGGGPPYLYDWSNGGVDSVIMDVPAGDYVITVTDTSNCQILDTLTVEEPERIQLEIVDSEDSYCDLPNGFITVQASGGIPDYVYIWDTQPQQIGNMASDLFGSPLGGPYTVTVTDQRGCTDSMRIDLGSLPVPMADFITDFFPLDSIIIPRVKGVNFTNQSQNAFTYIWDFGDGNASVEVNPHHTYTEPGFYEVILVAFDINLECPDTARLGFTLLPPGAIYMPNAFTPNFDGHNEGFKPIGVGVVQVRCRIFDRWGKLLTTLNSMVDEWDGTNKNGNPVQEGVYVWVLDATLNDGTRVNRAGTVTLIR